MVVDFGDWNSHPLFDYDPPVSPVKDESQAEAETHTTRTEPGTPGLTSRPLLLLMQPSGVGT